MSANVIDLDANIQQRRVHNNEQEGSSMNPMFTQSVASSVGNYVSVDGIISRFDYPNAHISTSLYILYNEIYSVRQDSLVKILYANIKDKN